MLMKSEIPKRAKDLLKLMKARLEFGGLLSQMGLKVHQGSGEGLAPERGSGQQNLGYRADEAIHRHVVLKL